MEKKYLRLMCTSLALVFLLLQNTGFYVFATSLATLAPDTPATAISLTPGKSYTKTVKSGEELWFKVDPSKIVNTKTHIKFEVKGISYYESIYNSLNTASTNKTHSDYTNKSSYISYPIAWVGPYYVKVRAASSGSMTLSSTPEINPPSMPTTKDSFCSSEALAKTNKMVLALLPTLRNFRDKVLKDSALGKEITNVYYSASSSILDDVVFDKSFRNNITWEILKISNLLKELNTTSKTGTSNYILTKSDYNAIFNIYKLVSSKVDGDLKSRIDKIWTTINMKEYVGLNLVKFMGDSGISNLESSKCEILVDTKDTLTIDEINANIKGLLRAEGLNCSVSARTVEDTKVKIDKSYVVNIDGCSDKDKIINAIKKGSEFKNVSSNISISALSSDIQYQSQWNLQNDMQKVPTNTTNGPLDVAGKKSADIDYKGLNKFLNTKSIPKTLIAVVDTGVNYELADLKDVVQVKDGHDFVNNDSDAMDDNNHGTHVSGIIAAENNNGYSIAGVNNATNILPVKVLDSNGSGTQENVAKGIKYAVDNGAKVINLSLGIRKSDGSPVAPTDVPQIETQLKYAYDKGVTVVAAAGNESKGNLSYPANSNYVVNVGATNNKDQLASFSNWGSGLDIVAPGVSIPSLLSNGQVAYLSGTSMSAPHVSAVAGLLYSINSKITPVKAKDILHKSSTDLDKIGYDTKYGYGRLNSSKAANAAQH
ncbi:S8 family peptidase [Clostridium algoriphilum]|uniref:S8 family peptidase n=1 Tax=Clostridium algoriphilum TaxID=198347 RepID=UPI001CF1E558|nr:S8 family peptidase [Clostridium algoriphilum]MCB2293574.1 S8 family peptidase [Clostridium algoriphilum]